MSRWVVIMPDFPADSMACGQQPSNSSRTHQAIAHPKRAVQFMPFAALKGYYELVAQAEDLTVEEVDDAELLSRSPDPEPPTWEDTVECSL